MNELLEYAERFFLRSRQVGDTGASVEAHIEQYRKSKGVQSDGDDDPGGPPLELAYLWEDFVALDKRRPIVNGTFLPIPFSEMEAYSRMMGVTFNSFECQVIDDLDDLRMQIHLEAERGRRAGRA